VVWDLVIPFSGCLASSGPPRVLSRRFRSGQYGNGWFEGHRATDGGWLVASVKVWKKADKVSNNVMVSQGGDELAE
jgi:hypothetical protein